MVRAQYHLQPRTNWMNDPNGPVYFNGMYHMFYQHNPDGPQWGNMTWGHAISQDMLHWKHLPHALSPTPGGPDKDGVFSGCAVVKDGRIQLLYTGVEPEVLCLATGDKEGSLFTKCAQNPVLTVDNSQYTGWRDPYVWEENGRYMMAMGAGYAGKGGTVLLYESDDLLKWKAAGTLAQGKEDETGAMWECPNFVKQGGWAALMVSAVPQGQVYCMDGRYQDGAFSHGRAWRYDLGDCFYAPNTMQVEGGHYVQWGWMRECGASDVRAQQGWQGMLTLPREVRVTKGGVRVTPLREVTRLRAEKLVEREGFALRSGDNALKGYSGQHLEIDIRLEPGAGKMVLEMLRGSEEKCMRLVYDGAQDAIEVDTTTLSGEAGARVVGGMVQQQGGEVHLRIFLDGTALEVFINERETLTTRAYPTQECDGLRLYADGGIRIHHMVMYRMGSAYEDDNS